MTADDIQAMIAAADDQLRPLPDNYGAHEWVGVIAFQLGRAAGHARAESDWADEPFLATGAREHMVLDLAAVAACAMHAMEVLG